MKKLLLFAFALLWLTGCQKEELNAPEYSTDQIALKAMPSYPDVLPLPVGFQPEGIAIGPRNDFYVGSIISGKIYKGDLRTGEGMLLADPADLGIAPASAVGMSLDRRSHYLFVAGGFDITPPFTGMVYVYDSGTGDLVRTFYYDSPFPVFLNDVIVTADAAYFTDAVAPLLYKIPLGKNGQLPGTDMLMVVPLTGFSTTPYWDDGFPLPIFGNGIDASPNGKMLFVANLNRGEIYNVDPETGMAEIIDLGEERLFYADGILLDGKTLYVAQNFFNRIAVVELASDLKSGTVTGYITDANLAIPSTIAEFGNYLYAVNARFDQAPPDGSPAPDVEFSVAKLKK